MLCVMGLVRSFVLASDDGGGLVDEMGHRFDSSVTLICNRTILFSPGEYFSYDVNLHPLSSPREM